MTQSTRKQSIKWFDLIGENATLLAEAGSIVWKDIDDILDGFYAALMTNNETRGFFASQQIVDHAKAAQKAHWKRLFAGDFSQAYFDSADRIGRVHFKIQLPVNLFLGGYARAGSDMIARVLKGGLLANRANSARAQVLMRAMLADTEAVIQSYYRAEGEDRARALELLSVGIGKLEEGDLTSRIPSEGFPDGFQTARSSFNNLQMRWSEQIAQAAGYANSVDGRMAETSRMASDLAERSQSQAATLEEAVASVSQIAATTKDAADRLEAASQRSARNRKAAEKGGTVVDKAIEAMQRIEESSEKISQIIEVIEDISFQTNLLALNAGVEAARAGEAGRGFAVVASEVRALAVRTSDSATEIKSLIAESSGLVQDGGELVRESGKSLAEIRGGASEVSGLMSEVSTMISEQSLSLGEIDTSVAELGRTTQDTAQLAGDVFETTSRLSQDSAALKRCMDSFRTTAGSSSEAAMDRRFERMARNG